MRFFDSKIGCFFFLNRQHGIISRYPSMKDEDSFHFQMYLTPSLPDMKTHPLKSSSWSHPLRVNENRRFCWPGLWLFKASSKVYPWRLGFPALGDGIRGRGVQIVQQICPKKPNKELKIHMQTCCTFEYMLEFLTFHESPFSHVWRCWRWSFGHWWMFGGAFQRQTWGQCQHWMNIWDEQR